MKLRTIYGRSVLRNCTTTRSFHLNMPRGSSQDLTQWFSEKFSAQPDSVNALMNLIYTQAPQNTVTPFNLFCRSAMERWTIKGLRIGNKERVNKRSVVVASGMQAQEHIPIGVSLYAAAVLSKRPIPGVEVTFFPVMKPKEFELQWHNEQTNHAKANFGIPLHSPDGFLKLTTEQYGRVVEGPLRSYAMKRGTSYVDFVMDLASVNQAMYLKENSLARPLNQAGATMQSFPAHPQLPSFPMAGDGVQSLFDQLVNPPTIILELRDKNKIMDEDQIVARGEQLITTIHKLIEETDATRLL